MQAFRSVDKVFAFASPACQPGAYGTITEIKSPSCPIAVARQFPSTEVVYGVTDPDVTGSPEYGVSP